MYLFFSNRGSIADTMNLSSDHCTHMPPLSRAPFQQQSQLNKAHSSIVAGFVVFCWLLNLRVAFLAFSQQGANKNL